MLRTLRAVVSPDRTLRSHSIRPGETTARRVNIAKLLPANVRKEEFSTQVAVFGEAPIRNVE